MARVSTTASLGVKVNTQHIKGFEKYDNTSPHHSFTIERNLSDDLSDEELVEKAEELHKMAETLVKKKINEELRLLNRPER